MQALQLTEWQHEPELREIDPPEPGPGAVLVRLVAAGACHSDVHLIHDFPPGLVPYELKVALSTTYWGTVPELHELIALAARGDITPVVQRYTLGTALDAYRAMQDGTVEGRAVIVHEA